MDKYVGKSLVAVAVACEVMEDFSNYALYVIEGQRYLYSKLREKFEYHINEGCVVDIGLGLVCWEKKLIKIVINELGCEQGIESFYDPYPILNGFYCLNKSGRRKMYKYNRGRNEVYPVDLESHPWVKGLLDEINDLRVVNLGHVEMLGRFHDEVGVALGRA